MPEGRQTRRLRLEISRREREGGTQRDAGLARARQDLKMSRLQDRAREDRQKADLEIIERTNRARREVAAAESTVAKDETRLARDQSDLAKREADLELARRGLRRQWLTGRIVPVRGSERNVGYRRRPPGQAQGGVTESGGIYVYGRRRRR